MIESVIFIFLRQQYLKKLIKNVKKGQIKMKVI